MMSAFEDEWASPVAQWVKNPPALKEGDPGSIPGWGRSLEKGWAAHSSVWASLVAQLVKNPSAMWGTWVPSLGWEDPLEEGTATHSSILAWRISRTVYSAGSQRVGHD